MGEDTAAGEMAEGISEERSAGPAAEDNAADRPPALSGEHGGVTSDVAAEVGCAGSDEVRSRSATEGELPTDGDMLSSPPSQQPFLVEFSPGVERRGNRVFPHKQDESVSRNLDSSKLLIRPKREKEWVTVSKDHTLLRLHRRTAQSHSGYETTCESIAVEDVVGIRIDVFYEGVRQRSEGQLLLVRKSKRGLDLQQWGVWVLLLMHCLVMWLSLSQLMGPITAGTVIAFGAHALGLRPAEIEDKDAPSGSDRSKDSTERLPSSTKQLRVVSLISIGCFFWILSNWVIMRIAGYFAATTALGASGILMYKSHDELVDRFGLTNRWVAPVLQKPEIIRYHQRDISNLLELREAIVRRDDPLRKRFRHLSVGSFWIESIMSTLLYSEVYNSIWTRQLTYKFLNTVMPVLFVFQILGIAKPFLSRARVLVVASLQSDVLLQIFMCMSDGLAFGVPDIVHTILMHSFQWTTVVMERVAIVVETFEYTRLKWKRFAESTQLLRVMGGAFSSFVGLGGQLLSNLGYLANSLSDILVGPGKYLLTIFNGLRNADATSNRTWGNRTFWHYFGWFKRRIWGEAEGAAANEENVDLGTTKEAAFTGQSSRSSTPDTYPSSPIVPEVAEPTSPSSTPDRYTTSPIVPEVGIPEAT